MNRLKDPPTWLTVATTLENPQPPPTCIKVSRILIICLLRYGFSLGKKLLSWKSSNDYATPAQHQIITRTSPDCQVRYDQGQQQLWLFVQQLAQDNNKANLEASHYWPFVRFKPPVTSGSPHKGPVTRTTFSCNPSSMKSTQFFCPVNIIPHRGMSLQV